MQEKTRNCDKLFPAVTLSLTNHLATTIKLEVVKEIKKKEIEFEGERDRRTVTSFFLLRLQPHHSIAQTNENKA